MKFFHLILFLLCHSISTGQPNIVVILADDMGYGDVGCYNPQSKIPTPHMDSLAANGMIFTDAHSPSSVCTPSRYGILTGRYAWRTTLKRSVFFNYERPLIDQGRTTVGSLLKSIGYRTACVGKWHLGLGWSDREGTHFGFDKPWPWSGGSLPIEEESKIDFTKPFWGGPTELGFDYFFGSSACPTCNPPYCYLEGDQVVDLPLDYYEGQFLEQRDGFRSPTWKEQVVDVDFARKAIEFIDQSATADKPFFLYLAASTPHEPCEPEVIPSFIRGVSEAGSRGDMVSLFDWMVGEIVGSLKAHNVFDQTLVFVTSDNGAKPGDYNRYTYGHKSCGDLRGFKGGIWEGGHRVPLIVSWPPVVEPGSINHDLVGLQDILATIADAVRQDLDGSMAVDSHSFLAGLRGQPGKGRKDLIHHSAMGVFAMRHQHWKLIVDSQDSGDYGRNVHGNHGGGPDPLAGHQLYNLQDDPFELYNLAADEPDKVDQLLDLLANHRNQGWSVNRN